MIVDDKLYDAILNSTKHEVNKDLIKESTIGIINSVNPIEIKMQGFVLRERNLIINNDLLDHTINFTNLTGNTESGTINISNGSFFVPCKLNQNDRVILFELDNGKYFLAYKVGWFNGVTAYKGKWFFF